MAAVARTGKQNYSLARAGETLVWGRLVEAEKPIPYQDTFADHVTEHELQSLYRIPITLGRIIQRALRISETRDDPPAIDIWAQDGIVQFHSRSPLGRVTDKLLLDAQPDVQIRIRAKPVRVGLDHGSQCRLFTQRGLIMGRGQMFYLVGATG